MADFGAYSIVTIPIVVHPGTPQEHEAVSFRIITPTTWTMFPILLFGVVNPLAEALRSDWLGADDELFDEDDFDNEGYDADLDDTTEQEATDDEFDQIIDLFDSLLDLSDLDDDDYTDTDNDGSQELL